MPAAWEYEQAVNNVSNFFNTDAQNVWNNINQYNLSPEQVQEILPTVDSFLYGRGVNSGYTAVKYANGEVASWNNVASLQSNSANAVEQAVNSNAGATSQQVFQLPANTNYSGTGNTFNGTKGVTGGVSGATHVISQISAGVAAAGLGISLGKTIDSALYNANPDFWDNHGLSSLNPETWNSITVDMSDSGWEGTLKRAFNAIFGLDPNTGKQQMYIDADAAAYLAMYMQEKGVFATGEGATQIKPDEDQKSILEYPNAWYTNGILYGVGTTFMYKPYATWENTIKDTLSSPVHAMCAGTSSVAIIYYFSETPFTNYSVQVKPDGGEIYPTTTTARQYRDVANNVYYYLAGSQINIASGQISVPPINAHDIDSQADVAYILLHGAIRTEPQPAVDGITNQEDATAPDFTGCTTPADYKNALQQQYPDLFNNAITQDVAQPDGTTKRRTYIPIGTPSANGTQDTQPVTNPDTTGQKQSDTSTDSNAATNDLLQTLVRYITNIRTPDTPDTPNPKDTGDGTTPPVVAPTGSASALWTVYNPTQAQLNSFGAWLWSSNFIDQVLKLFNNPMQSIIGVHKIFASPSISGSNNITVGYLDSGVSANVVGAQYTTINCGSVKVHEQFGNVFDYEDTQVRLYLPFIGIVQLDTADVMRGSVSVVYHVDVITGACLAEVKVTRDGGGGTLYQFSGDAAVRYPISSGSYMGVVSGVLGVVGGIASGIMSGGATLPMAAGAIAGGLSGAKTQVQHSGSFAGNAGAMGGKKPYLIIERPQSAVADGYGAYQGTGANDIASVGAMSGYFKMTDIHTAGIMGASEAEIATIVQTLESGAIA